ncbi:MAG: hypothetical protein QOG91_565 [Candidatus Parcubacteria bacterium]|jgi:hypothetical protein|nr:hypothetical protein [Candidatus Parcubacteria bacterium]
MKLKTYFTLYLLSALLFPGGLDAAADNTTYKLLEPLPCIVTSNGPVGGQTGCTPGTQIQTVKLLDYVQYAFNLLIAGAAVSAVFMIVWGGLQYMTTDSFQGKSSGITRVKNAVYGLIMVLATFIILRTVNPALTTLPLSLVPPLAKTTKSSVNAFFADMENEAKQNKTETAQTIASRTKAKADVTAAQKDLSDLQTKYEAALAKQDTSAADAIAAQIKDKESDVTNTLKVQAVFTATSGMIGVLNLLTASHDPEGNIDLESNSVDTIKKAEVAVDHAHTESVTRVLQVGSELSPDQKQDVDNTYNYVAGLLKIQEYLAEVRATTFEKFAAGTDATNQSGTYSVPVQKSINAITDPVKKASLQKKYNTIFLGK